MNRALLISCVFVLGIGCFELAAQQDSLHMWYEQPARDWNEALPIGNGKMGAMVFGGVSKERLQLNEETVWSGGKHDFVNPEARKALPLVRRLLFEGKYVEAKEMAQTQLMGDKKVPS
jgi:alpha-L-fucosidase 2